MDYVEFVKQSFKVAWQNRILWVFALIASCMGGGGSQGLNFNSNFSNTGSGSPGSGSSPFPPEILSWINNNTDNLIVIGIAALCVLLIIGFLLYLVGVFGSAALTAGVADIEENGSTSWARATAVARRRYLPFLGLHLVLAAPGALIGLILLGGGLVFAVQTLIPMIRSNTTPRPEALLPLMAGGFVGLACLAFLAFMFQLVGSVLSLFGAKAVLLHEMSVMDGLRAGWRMFRGHLAESLVIFLVTVVIGFILGIAIAIVTVPVAFGVAFGAMSTASSGLGNLPWLAIIGAGLLITALSLVVTTASQTISGTMWTRAYVHFARSMPPQLPNQP